MIKSRKDLHFYLKEDAKRNGIHGNLKYWIKLFACSENACAYRYIKCMRYCEYHLNNSSNIFNKICYYAYKLKLSRLGRKYNISIEPNSCGYGLRLMHLSGGGGGFCLT